MNQKPEYISYYEHEAEIARNEQHLHYWIVATFFLLLALIGTNFCWFIYENSQVDYVQEEYTAETEEGDATNLIARDSGVVNYGEGDIQADESEGQQERETE